MTKKQMQRLFYETMDREKRHILSEFVQVKGPMPLLMKPRNKQEWTPQDKRELKLQLKCLSRMGTYVAMLVMPGGFAMLPIMAWWLDRRRNRGTAAHVH
jgi:hypothetical protein